VYEVRRADRLGTVEFAIADISVVTWNSEPFQRLAIPERQKRLIRSAAISHVKGDANNFDDFVEGKGRGLVMLLQYDMFIPFPCFTELIFALVALLVSARH
jgi:hypothetical protein